MKLLSAFYKKRPAPPPTPSEAARVLSRASRDDYRERVRAKCREMQATMGRPALPEFEPRR